MAMRFVFPSECAVCRSQVMMELLTVGGVYEQVIFTRMRCSPLSMDARTERNVSARDSTYTIRNWLEWVARWVTTFVTSMCGHRLPADDDLIDSCGCTFQLRARKTLIVSCMLAATATVAKVVRSEWAVRSCKH